MRKHHWQLKHILVLLLFCYALFFRERVDKNCIKGKKHIFKNSFVFSSLPKEVKRAKDTEQRQSTCLA